MKNVSDKFIYKIVSKLDNNKVISEDIANEKPIIYHKKKEDNQNWKLVYSESYDAYKIVNVKTDKILGYEDDRSMNLPLYPLETNSLYCHWKFESVDVNYYVIKNAGNPQKVLDVKDSDPSSGNSIIIFKMNDSTHNTNQLFKLSKVRFVDGKSCEPTKLSTCALEENAYGSLEELKYKIFSSELFIKKWASVADMLGYAWCGGTNTTVVGEDFSIEKKGNDYYIKANYDANDPYAEGYRCNERLVMKISNIKLTFDPDSITLGEQSVEKLEPILVASTSAINHTNQKATIAKEIEYTVGQTTSSSTSNTTSHSIEIGSSFQVSVKGVGTEHSFAYGFTNEYSWGEQKDKSEESKVKDIYTADVEANSTLPIHALLYKSIAKVPYQAIAKIDYSITLTNFLRYEGNAYKGSPTDRPRISYTFGNDKLSAPEDLYDKFKHRNISGYSDWDFEWVLLNEDCDYIKIYMSHAFSPNGAKISGMFTNVNSSHVIVRAGEPPLKDNESIKHGIR